jgi:hypothetical protein
MIFLIIRKFTEVVKFIQKKKSDPIDKLYQDLDVKKLDLPEVDRFQESKNKIDLCNKRFCNIM